MTYYTDGTSTYEFNHVPTGAEWRAVSAAEGRRLQRAECVERLRNMLPPGTKVATLVTHVSRSGMARSIRVFAPGDDGHSIDISGSVAHVIGDRFDSTNGGVRVMGCGMDMGFHVVYSLSRALYPHGFECIGDRCPSNDHGNRETRTQHPEGGYALRHVWL